MVITGIIILRINHISISVGEKFVEQKINKLTVLLRNHDLSGFVDVLSIDQNDGTTSYRSPVSEVSIPSMMVFSLL